MSAASKKRFGRTTPANPLPVVSFTVVFDVDGDEVEHHFKARPQITYGDMVALKRYEGDDQGAILPHLDRLIRRSLLNDDGVPLKWRPNIAGGKFTAPDGSEQPVADLLKFTTHEAGSSRRRWVELIDSDDAVIDFEQVLQLFEWLAEVAGDRPTERPQHS